MNCRMVSCRMVSCRMVRHRMTTTMASVTTHALLVWYWFLACFLIHGFTLAFPNFRRLPKFRENICYFEFFKKELTEQKRKSILSVLNCIFI